ARVACTPVAHVHLVVRRALMGFHVAHVDTKLEATEVEVQVAVQANLVDFAVLPLIADAHDLRTEVIGIEPVLNVTARTSIGSRLVREYPARRNRQITREVVFLGNEASTRSGGTSDVAEGRARAGAQRHTREAEGRGTCARHRVVRQ